MMRGHPRVIGFLQRALAHELSAAGQYVLQAATADSMGLRPMADKLRGDARAEFDHAEIFAAQLLKLGIAPQAGPSQVPPVGRSALEILTFGLATENEAIRLYREARDFCTRIGDAAHAAVFARIHDDEAEHARELQASIQALGGG